MIALSEPAGASAATLSERERFVISQIAAGKTIQAIALATGLSIKTIITLRQRVLEKLGLHDTTSLIHYALQHGL